MLVTYLKTAYQRIFVDLVARALCGKLSANQVTLFAGIAGTLLLPCLYFGFPSLAVALLLFSGYLDTLDGSLARLSESSTEWGTVFDITMDRWVEFMVILGLWSVSPDVRSFYIILMLGSVLLCVTSFLVVGIFSQNDSAKGFYYSPGIIERAEAFAFFIAMILWPAYFSILALLFSLLVLLTAIIRLKQFYDTH